LSAVMTATDRDADCYEYAERRIASWAVERRQQDRQFEAFREQLFTMRHVNRDDGATAAVFHGARQMTRRERMLQEHREQLAEELRKTLRKHKTIVRRAATAPAFCRHCGDQLTARDRTDFKCEACKADPDLVTARGTETRLFVDRPEPQPRITPLSADAKRIEALFAELPSREQDVLERCYLCKETELEAAESLGISVRSLAGRLCSAVSLIARALANDKRVPV